MSLVVRILAALIATFVVRLSLSLTAHCTEFDDISELVGRSVALLVGQDYKHEQLPSSFREYAMSDDTNEDLGHATHLEMIVRALSQQDILLVYSSLSRLLLEEHEFECDITNSSAYNE
jgi:vancomycin permeability regulator SanA